MILKILVSVLLLNQVATGQIVSVKLYYECLCPFSREMIINHLYPTFKSEIGKYMNIELLPINNGREVNLYRIVWKTTRPTGFSMAKCFLDLRKS